MIDPEILHEIMKQLDGTFLRDVAGQLVKHFVDEIERRGLVVPQGGPRRKAQLVGWNAIAAHLATLGGPSSETQARRLAKRMKLPVYRSVKGGVVMADPEELGLALRARMRHVGVVPVSAVDNGGRKRTARARQAAKRRAP